MRSVRPRVVAMHDDGREDQVAESERHAWREAEVVAKAGSTRPVTMVSGELVVFTKAALEGIAEQVRTRFVVMQIEHLAVLPPVGRWHDADIVTADDGADELVLRGRLFTPLRPVGADPDPWVTFAASDPRPPAPQRIEIDHVGFEPRNFSATELRSVMANAPVRVEEEHRWSALPPLEWVLAIPVVWGLVRFAGSFLDTLGRESAEALVRWLRDSSDHAMGSERDRIVTVRFELQEGTMVLALVPVASTASLEDEVLAALDAAGRVAEFAGAHGTASSFGEVRQAAFLWQAGEWHLAWWVAADDTLRITNWFLEHEPDPSRFLGRPLLPDSSG
jgi:hypothetical protein